MIQYLIIRIIESSGQTYTEATKVRDNQTNSAVEVNNKGKRLRSMRRKNKKSSRLFIFRK
ncbi:TPA: DUF1381 domain-containing protein [Staphylococcus pseudintermedius]|nr:DUF1381 domain-containing protein [Staphylococcus pseudintermedius]